MRKRSLAWALWVAVGCQPVPSSLEEPAGAAQDLAPAPERVVPEAAPEASQPEPAIDPIAPIVPIPPPAPPSLAAETEAAQEPTAEASVAGEGELAPDFLALSQPIRNAVDAFFARGPGAVRDPGGTVDAVVGTSGGAAAHVGAGFMVRGESIPGYPGLYNITLNNTGSGYKELFLLQLPDSPPVASAPMLVVFHKYGVSHGDVIFHTSFISEVRSRGWYLVAPLGGSGENFGSLASQVNVRAALQWVVEHLPIDGARIYGVGFSMGGGGVAGYAARHLDPAGAMFAAIVDHTGSVSLTHVWANEGTEIRAHLETLFGGPPATSAFQYQRCSTIDLHPVTNIVGSGTDMVRNLKHVPIRTWMAENDPYSYLKTQTQALAAYVQNLNPMNTATVVHGMIHEWSTLDETAVCDWLQQFQLQQPMSGTTLADQNGIYHRFLVEQDAAGAFTPFGWSVNVVQNKITISGTGNLRMLTVDAPALGLSYVGSLYLDITAADATGDKVLFPDVRHAPNSVLRNGVAASATYDSVAQTLLITEIGGSGTARWVISF